MRVFVAGGDRRQAELVHLLRRDGHEVIPFGLDLWDVCGPDSLDLAAEADIVVLPLPLCKEEGMLHCATKAVSMDEVWKKLCPHQLILAGQIQKEELRRAESRGLQVVDYFRREELTVANAAATAEGTVQIAMEQMDEMLLGKRVLVLGFGRIGKLLCSRFSAMGAVVSAAARKAEQLEWIRAYGWNGIRMDALDDTLPGCDLVINTIPAMVLSSPRLKRLPENCLLIDVASEPGIDFAAARQLGLQTIYAKGIPGRKVPRSAAEIILRTLYYIMEERREGA